MPVRRLWLENYRNHESLDLSLPDGITAIVGENGAGKTSVLEGLAWLSSGSSFRGVPTEALIRHGTERAVVRAEVTDGSRTVLLEAELTTVGRNRIQVNRNPVGRLRELLGHFRATVFAPDDLFLVKGGPALRRGYLDDLLVAMHPRHHELRTDLDRILRQRNTLLKQARGQATMEIAATLDVWDAKLTAVGEDLVRARRSLITELAPVFAEVLCALTGRTARVSLRYMADWDEAGGLAEALAASRDDDLRRGVTTTGPHRDEVEIRLAGLPARIQASQGEQRSLALALRLAGHRVVGDRTGTEPVILLDDVFSELDTDRATALVELLPDCQTLLTSAGVLPAGVQTPNVVRISAGRVADPE